MTDHYISIFIPTASCLAHKQVMYPLSSLCTIRIKIIRTCSLADHWDWAVTARSLMPISDFCVPYKNSSSKSAEKLLQYCCFDSCWEQCVAQFTAMRNGHTSAKGVHHNSDSSATVVGQLCKPMHHLERPGRLKNKVHCSRNKDNNQCGSRYNWFVWHDACSNLLPCIEAEWQQKFCNWKPSGEKIEEFSLVQQWLISVCELTIPGFYSLVFQINWQRQLVIFLWWYLPQYLKCIWTSRWFSLIWVSKYC